MYCPRINHFVRLNANGTVSLCGHMVKSAQFDNFNDMVSSAWMTDIITKFEIGEWPAECIRCQKSEAVGEKSIRQYALDEWNKPQKRSDYLHVGGVLDNVCNAACQTCNEHHSTFLGAKKGIPIRVDNRNGLQELPWDRITHLDLNGGEPSYSKGYKDLLKNPPPNLTHLRLNTNCNTTLWELGSLADSGVHVTVTVSLDGIGRVHEYMRWPILWNTFFENLTRYQNMPVTLNTWTTLSALNIADFNNIVAFTKEHGIDHSWAFLENPDALNVKYANNMTTWARVQLPENIANMVAVEENNQEQLDAYIREQDAIRKISIKDYIK